MTEERAIQIIKNEVKCLIKSKRGCDSKCDKCSLGIDPREILSAYDLAIKTLSEKIAK